VKITENCMLQFGIAQLRIDITLYRPYRQHITGAVFEKREKHHILHLEITFTR